MRFILVFLDMFYMKLKFQAVNVIVVTSLQLLYIFCVEPNFVDCCLDGAHTCQLFSTVVLVIAYLV